MLLHSRYRQYSLAMTLSFTAFGAAMLVRGWLVNELTGSPFQVTLVLGLFMLPMLLFTSAGGVLADRFPLPRLTAIGDQLAFVWYAMLAALIFFEVAESWHVLGLSFAHGTSAALTSPARQSMITDLVPPPEGRTAIGLSTMTHNVSQIIGPFAGATLISGVAVEAAALFSAVLVLPSSLIYLRLRPRRRRDLPAVAPAGLVQRLLGGITYVVKEPSLRLSLLAATVLVLTANTWGSLFPSIASDLGRGAGGLALISMGVGVGSVFGSLGSVMLGGRFEERTIELMSGFAFVLLVFALGMSNEFALSVPIAVLAAFAATVYFVSNMTAMQLSAPEAVRGRVIAARFVMFGMAPLGMVALGALAEVMGPRQALAVFAVIGGLGFAAVQAAIWRQSEPA